MTEPCKGWLHRHTTRLPLQRLRMLTTMQGKGKGNKKEKEVSMSLLDSPLQLREHIRGKAWSILLPATCAVAQSLYLCCRSI